MLGQKLIILPGNTEQEIDSSFASVPKQQIRALVITADGFLISRQDQIVSLTVRREIVFGVVEHVICTDRAHHGHVLRATDGGHLGSEGFGNLDRERSNAAGCAVNQDPLRSFDPPLPKTLKRRASCGR